MRTSLLIAAMVSGAAMLVIDPASMAAGARQQLTLMRAGERPTITGPAANFTGKAVIDRQVRPDESKRIMGSMVSFEAGARTAWHTHPLGQTLIVTSGCGWVQTEGGELQEIRPGDVIWTPAGVRHWHGAQAHSSMSHYAIVEPLNGQSAEWMEHVTDKQYTSGTSTRCQAPAARPAN
jgi:quercetin dioxygenase-like cupin family protein